MTGFNLDFNDKFEGGGIADGVYEVIVNIAKEDATKGGSEYMELDLIIRNDVQQKHHNQHIFHKIWKKKDTGKYNPQMFNTLGWAFKLQEGKNYNSIDELLQDFFMKVAKVTVKNEKSEPNAQGVVYDNLNVKRWEQSAFPQSQHQFKQKDSASNANQFGNAAINISDDDLPF